MIHWIPLINSVNLWLQVAFTVGATIYALVLGGPAARAAAVVNALGWIVGSISNYLVHPASLQLTITCTQDALVAAGFLFLAVRYNSPWLCLGVIAQGLQLGLDFLLIGDWTRMAWQNRFAAGVVLNGLTYVLQFSVLGVTLEERRRLALAGPVRV